MKLIFINPASVDNLAEYDCEILNNLPTDTEILYVCNKDNQYIKDLNENIRVKCIFKYSKYSKNILRGISYCLSLFKLFWIVLFHPANIIHTQWPKIIGLDTILLRVYKCLNIPIVHTAHNILPHDDTNNKTYNSYKRYYKLTSGIIVHTIISEHELESKFGIPKDNIFVNKHGILKSKYDKNERDGLIKTMNKNFDLNNKIIFSSIGFQSYYKGLDFIIDYWNNIGKSNPNIHLIIAGSCRYKRVLELQKYSNVNIIDKILSNEELSAISKLTDVLLLPYIKISQSGILMTAINDEIPVLISNIGGLPEPLYIAKIGWNIGEPNYNHFKDTMNEIILRPDQIEKIKNDCNAWNKLKEEYSWQKIAYKTFAIYQSIIKKIN